MTRQRWIALLVVVAVAVAGFFGFVLTREEPVVVPVVVIPPVVVAPVAVPVPGAVTGEELLPPAVLPPIDVVPADPGAGNGHGEGDDPSPLQ